MEDDEIIIGIENSNTNKNRKKTKKKTRRKDNKPNRKNNKKKNEKYQKRQKNLKVVAFIVIFIVLLILLLSSSLFNINTIIVEGNNQLSDEKVISISSIELYTNMFKMSTTSAKLKLEENAYIESAKVTRKLPSSIVITIEEREPAYMLQFADSYVYINNQGYMLEISNDKIEVPIITGFTTDLSNIKPGNRLNTDDLNKMKIVIKIYQILETNEIADILTKIDVSDEKDYTLYFDTEGKKVHLGDTSDLNTKVVYLKSILEAVSGKEGEIFLNVDLNTEKAYFRENVE